MNRYTANDLYDMFANQTNAIAIAATSTQALAQDIEELDTDGVISDYAAAASDVRYIALQNLSVSRQKETTMAAFSLMLECGHETDWQEAPGDGGAPYNGLPVFCAECGAEQEIAECSPWQYVIETITLSENEPEQSSSYYGGYKPGTQATIFYDTRRGQYGYCLHGIGDSGLYSESEDVIGFASPDAAREAAEKDWQE